jgi:hypothetical protein
VYHLVVFVRRKTIQLQLEEKKEKKKKKKKKTLKVVASSI